MKLGAVFPTTEIGDDPHAIRDWAQAAEALGYASIIAYDHVLGADPRDRKPPLTGPYTHEHAFHEPLALLAYLAAATERIELSTGVLILPQRQAALVAKQAAEIQLLSRGRLRLGVGTGWNHVEYEALGVPFAKRGARLDEQLDVMQALWSEELVDFRGAYHRVDRASILPRPPSRIPVWFGAIAPVAVARAARRGDGLMFGGPPAMSLPMLELALRELDAAGRSRAEFGAEATVDYSFGEERCAAELEQWRRAGGTHFALRAMDTVAHVVGGTHVGYGGPQGYIDALRRFRSWVG